MSRDGRNGVTVPNPHKVTLQVTIQMTFAMGS